LHATAANLFTARPTLRRHKGHLNNSWLDLGKVFESFGCRDLVSGASGLTMTKLLNIFAHRSIAAKLAAMSIAGALGMALVAVTVLLIARGELVAERIEKAHAIVDAVWNIADYFQHAADAGELTQEEAKKRFVAVAGSVRFEDQVNFVFIYDTEAATMVMTGIKPLIGKNVHEFKDANGLPFATVMLDIAKRQGHGTLQFLFPRSSADPTPYDKIAYFRNSAPWHLLIASAVYVNDIDATFWRMAQTASAVIVGLLLLSTAIAWLITRSVVRPLSGLKARMATLSTGELDAAVADTDRPDEIGEMARTVQVFKEAMIETARLRAEQQEAERLQSQRRQSDMNKLADQFESAVGQIIATVSTASTQLEASASTLSKNSEQAQTVTNKAAAASANASTNVRSVAAASEEMASSVHEISRQVQISAKIAGDAVDQAQKTDVRMNQLSQAAGRIGAVVELINTIAGQTNLLALNATIEAARAGDAGRGFAVVAAEVKALAEQTAKATDEISQQINDIQSATQDSVAAIKEIGTTIGRISEISSTIATAVQGQGAATQEISRNVQRAAAGTAEVASNITDVQRGASETGSASSQVFAAAQSLSHESNRLKLEVGKFIGTVRAA
jgi:methyl-accepting chemotaxis protein